MKGLKSKLGKAVDAAEGIGIGIGHGLAHVRDKFRGDTKDNEEDFQKPPELGSVPSCIPPDDSTAPAKVSRRQVSSIREETNAEVPIIQKKNPLETFVSVFTDEGEPVDSRPWWKKDNGLYLSISVREARDLVPVDQISKSLSSYVKISLGDEDGKGALEAQTRTCHRNRNPLFAQSFFFPLEDLDAKTRVCIDVHGATTNALTVMDHFAGQVLTTLGHLLEPVGDTLEPFTRWYRLTRRRSNDRVSGELLLIVGIVPHYVYDAVHWSEESSNLLDPAIQKQLLSDYSVNIHLREMKQMKVASGEDIAAFLSTLDICVRLGSSKAQMKLDAKEVVTCADGMIMFKIDQKMVLPLKSCFDVPKKKMSKKQRDEIGDLKIYLMEGKEAVAKTQMPIWDIPVVEDSDEGDEARDGNEDDEISEGVTKPGAAVVNRTGSLSFRLPSQSSEKNKTIFGRYLNFMAGEKQAKPSNLSKSQPDSSNTSFGFGPAAASSATSVQNQAVPVEVPIQITAAMSNDTDSSEVILESPFACLSAPAATPMLQTSSNMQRLSSEPCAGASDDGQDKKHKFGRVTGLALTRNLMRDNMGRIDYKRPVEVYLPIITSTPQLHACLWLDDSLKETEVPPGETIGVDDVVEEENPVDGEDDGEAPQKITLPPALPVFVTEVKVAGRPIEVFDTLFKIESSFRAKIIALEELRDVVTGQWVPDTSIKGAKTREQTYIRPLQIPIPMAPKQCNVKETHYMLAREAGGFVFEKKVQTDAPKGDTFFILCQITGVPEGSNGTFLRSSFKIEWIKSPGFLKGAIEGGALSSTKKLLLEQMNCLLKELGPPLVSPGNGGAVKKDGTVASSADASLIPSGDRLGAASAPSSDRSLASGSAFHPQTALLATAVVLLIAILWVSILQLSATRSLSITLKSKFCPGASE